MSGGGRAGGRGNGPPPATSVPAGARKLVQGLKEIVNCTEAEIYAMLRECNMDPNEAVHRLLSQDTFQEVKSKRDRKKEIREPPDSRSRTVNSSSTRGTRVGIDRVTRSTSSQLSSTDHGATKGRIAHKKENGTSTFTTTSISDSSTLSNNPTQRSTVQSNSASLGIAIHGESVDDGFSMPLQSSSGYQNSWLGKPGQLSMADIVKMGRPQVKPSSVSAETQVKPSGISAETERSYMSHKTTMPSISHDVEQTQVADLPPESDEIPKSFDESALFSDHDLAIAENQHISEDGWFLVDKQRMESRSAPEISDASAIYASSSQLPSSIADGTNLETEFQPEEVGRSEENLNDEPLPAESRSTSTSERQIQVDTSVDASNLKEGLLTRTNSYHSQRLEFDDHEGKGSFPAGAGDDRVELSSANANLRKLSLHEELSTQLTEAKHAVIIPDHLRVKNADCAHICFGSFVSGTFSASWPSKPQESNLEVASEDSDERNHEYYDDEHLNTTLTGKMASITGTAAENLDMTSASQAEVVENDLLDSEHESQYNHPSVSSYAFSSSTQPNATTSPHGNTEVQNLSSFSTLMQHDALQNSILASSIPPHDFDLPLSPLLTTQSMTTRYNTTIHSISGPNVSMSEALNPGLFPNPQTTPQSLSNTTLLASAALPQHLPVHHYSQPALPLGHFANMMGYPFIHHSYTYLPSFQQAYTANSPFHQTPAAVPGAGMKYSQPQYKSSLPATTLAQASSIASAYGGFGNSSNLPNGFTLNQTSPSAGTTIGLEEALSLQYKEGNYMSLQQSENPAMWIHGAGSRTMSALPANTFYNYMAQNQLSELRQSQQASQFGALGYPNLYNPQAGPSREHQQNPSEGNLNGPQSMQSQPTSQIWQRGY